MALLAACGARSDLSTGEDVTPAGFDAGAPRVRDAGAPRTRDAGALSDAGGPPPMEDAGAPRRPDAGVSDDPVDVGPTTFRMGSPTDEERREPDEVRHEVTVTRAFEVARTELTQRQWRDVVGTEPSFHRGCGDDCPVETINCWEALAFANERSALEGLPLCYELVDCTGELGRGCVSGEANSVTGCDTDFRCAAATFAGLDCAGYRLPTESEWELAARGGSTGAWPIGDDVARVNEIGWCAGAGGEVHPVAQLRANPWGLYDTAGNVYEWVWDHYAEYPSEPVTDPLGPPVGRQRCMRGGSYAFGDFTCRSANRGAREAEKGFAYIGLRLVRTLP